MTPTGEVAWFEITTNDTNPGGVRSTFLCDLGGNPLSIHRFGTPATASA